MYLEDWENALRINNAVKGYAPTSQNLGENKKTEVVEKFARVLTKVVEQKRTNISF